MKNTHGLAQEASLRTSSGNIAATMKVNRKLRNRTRVIPDSIVREVQRKNREFTESLTRAERGLKVEEDHQGDDATEVKALDGLSFEMLSIVFSYLNSSKYYHIARCLNKKMKEFTDSKYFWSSFQIGNDMFQCINEPFLAKLRESEVKLVDLSGVSSEETDTKIGQVLTILEEKPSLNSLNMQGVQIQEFTAKCLANIIDGTVKRTSMVTLDLAGCFINDFILDILLEAFVVNTTIETLVLDNNNISRVGFIELFSKLQRNRSIKSLSLSNNRIEDDLVAHVGNFLLGSKTLQHIDLSYNSIGDEGIKEMSAFVGRSSALKHLVLNNNKITHVGAEALATTLSYECSLQSLEMASNKLDMRGLKSLFDFVKTSTTLKTLDVSMDWSRNVRKPRLVRNNTLTSSRSRLPRSDSTSFPTESLKDAIIDGNLEKLVLTGNELSSSLSHIAEALRENCSLEHLVLSRCGVKSENFAELMESLVLNTRLRVLDLSHNDLGDNCYQKVAEMIRSNQELAKLDLSQCHLGPQTGRVLGGALILNTALRRIDVSTNKLGDDGCKSICRALKMNTIIQDINLGNNEITDESCPVIKESLKFNSTLTTLNLRGNLLTEAGTAHLASALESNCKLRSLVLSWNNLNDAGTSRIVESLANNTNLKALTLSFKNYAQAYTARSLNMMLKSNSSLKYLDLRFVSMEDEQVKQVLEAVKENKTLTKLLLDGNNTSEDFYRETETCAQYYGLVKLDI